MSLESLSTIEAFLFKLAEHLEQSTFVKLTLSKNRGADKELQRIVIRQITLRNLPTLSFVFSYKTRDITKNYDIAIAEQEIKRFITHDFKAANLHTIAQEIQLDISKKGKATMHSRVLKTPNKSTISPLHNKQKKRFVELNRPYLQALGVTDNEHNIIPTMSRKWKQINKFIEIFSQAFEQSPLSSDQAIQVVDFGSGKGYLTFAIHDYLYEQLQSESWVTGVELRAELANLCADIASSLQHKGLNFVCGDVKTHAPKHTDVMIALHACDIATDYAIHYGIRTDAAIIMCSPCCHKQIRPQMQSPALMKPMLQYGVHLGQEAEMVTDSLRALLLEAHGYTTKVFEFISLEHTNKNKMILATKRKTPKDNTEILQQIADIKSFYGIQEHCLESLLVAN